MLFSTRPHAPANGYSGKNGRHTAPRQPADPMPTLPRSLSLDGRSLVYSGPGRAAGTHVYLDLAHRVTIDLYLVRVTSRTATHTFTTVPENPGLAVICVANADVPPGTAIGNWLLVGPLTFDQDGLARAHHAWRPHVSGPQRFSGIVSRVYHTGRFGQIAGPNGKMLFFHIDDVPPGIVPGVNLMVGDAVTYREELTAKGWNARDVHPA